MNSFDEVEKHLADLVARRQVVRDVVGVTESSHALLQALPVLDVQPPKNFIARRILT